MKRSLYWVSMVLLVALLASLVAGCSSQPAAAPTSAPQAAAPTTAPAQQPATSAAVDRIKKAGKLVVLVDSTFTPMEFKDDKGAIVGFDVDLMNEYAKSLGVKLEIQNIAWDGIFAALLASKGDMVWSCVSIDEDRKKSMAFSDVYYQQGQAILIPADNTTIKGPEDLKGKVVAVQIDTTGQKAAEAIDGVKEIKKLDGGVEACIMTEQGKTEATIMDIVVAGYFAKDHPKVKLAAKEPFTKEDLGVAMRPADTDLVKSVNEFLAKAKTDGTMDKIKKNWGL